MSGGALFVQVVLAPVADRAGVLDHLPDALALVAGELVGMTAGVTADGRFIGVARFADLAGTVWWDALGPWLAGPAEVRSSDDVEVMLGGGSEGAGFVEVIEGRTGDRTRFMELERQLERRFAAERPDFLGSTLVWWDGGAWMEVAAFTSEADVRAGDARTLSPGVEQLIAAWEEVAGPSAQLDLVEPFVWSGETAVRVVAGCLFEVSLPAVPGGWRWANPGPSATLLAGYAGDGRQQLRFRAEAPGAEAGTVELRFEQDGAGAPVRSARVRIAPEQPDLRPDPQ